jgi:hypothetical protein
MTNPDAEVLAWVSATMGAAASRLPFTNGAP